MNNRNLGGYFTQPTVHLFVHSPQIEAKMYVETKNIDRRVFCAVYCDVFFCGAQQLSLPLRGTWQFAANVFQNENSFVSRFMEIFQQKSAW